MEHYVFATKAQAKKFDQECRKHFILVENETPYIMHIHDVNNLKDEIRPHVIDTVRKIYCQIMGYPFFPA